VTRLNICKVLRARLAGRPFKFDFDVCRNKLGAEFCRDSLEIFETNAKETHSGAL
jgi:hypothetical protein